MKQLVAVWMALSLGVAVEATEPAARPKPAAKATVPPAPTAEAAKPTSKPLDLRVGDVRKYMLPREYFSAILAPDADANTVVVEGQREVVPMRMVEDVPGGLASLWYSVKDPKNAWRILAPTVNFKDGPTVDKVPPPIFRWGP